MPTYEYKCNACGYEFERFQSIMADPIKRCPECGKAKVKRLMGTGAGVIFKGSGFYITDYRSESYKDKAKAESGAASGGEAGKTDAKPATTGDKPAAPATSDSKDTKTPAKSETPASKSASKTSKGKRTKGS